jgi:hypothetical protein
VIAYNPDALTAWALFQFAESGYPKRTIPGEEGPYLTRYTLAELPDGGHLYLHFFHRGDADLELHNHPWPGRSLILTGGYREERREGDAVVERVYRRGDVSVLEPDTFHRVDLLTPETGCWTLFLTGAREQSWGFWDRVTGVFTPWREAIARRGLS